jgi:hypothetical protein
MWREPGGNDRRRAALKSYNPALDGAGHGPSRSANGEATMIRSIAALLCLGVALAAPHAWAQNPQPAPPGVTPVPMAPANGPSPPPEKIAPPGTDVNPDKPTLSDKLAQQQGTLQPPQGVDPGMAVSPPAEARGTMPIIPPPGSPGGNPKVVPK